MLEKRAFMNGPLMTKDHNKLNLSPFLTKLHLHMKRMGGISCQQTWVVFPFSLIPLAVPYPGLQVVDVSSYVTDKLW